ncbi:MAG: stage 0 sporulation protein [Chloroflexi bacterium]|nr:stage 0 sporulation protein [Chloroflexota bacterium]
MDPVIVGIRFQEVGKLYHFDSRNVPDIKAGDFAIVHTSRGHQMGRVMGIIQNPPKPPRGTWKKIERRATAGDLVLRQTWEKKEVEALINCRAETSKVGLKNIKIVKGEFTFDGLRLNFLYNSEEEGDINLTKLQKNMKKLYPNTKIEMRRIGPRDFARIVGGMGACGMEARCCSKFLTEFSPISIKMAKAQGVSLDPSEITGMCGRLRCCLIYEYEQYVEARKTLPKRKKRVITPAGEGKVIDVLPLKQAVVVRLTEDNTRVEYSIEDIEPWAELEALRKKSKEPCSIHGDSGCSCNRNDRRKKTNNKKK